MKSLIVVSTIILALTGIYGVTNAQNVYLDTSIITWTNTSYGTMFNLIAMLDPNVTADDFWFSLGFRNYNGTSNYVVFRYRNSPDKTPINQVTHRYSNPRMNNTVLISYTAPTIGLTNTSIMVMDGLINCQFIRAYNVSNKTNNPYLAVNNSTQFYLITSYGSGNINGNGTSFSTVSNETYNLFLSSENQTSMYPFPYPFPMPMPDLSVNDVIQMVINFISNLFSGGNASKFYIPDN